MTTPGLGQYISGAILFEETLFQSTSSGKKMVDCLTEQTIVPGIKVDKGLVPLSNSNGESWCMGLDGLDKRCAEYYKAGACLLSTSSASDQYERGKTGGRCDRKKQKREGRI